MERKQALKKAKRILAFVLAFALFGSTLSGYDLSLKAAGIPALSVSLSQSGATYTGEVISFPEVIVTTSVEKSDGSGTETKTLTENTDYTVMWLTGENFSSTVTEIKSKGTYRCLVMGKRDTEYSQSTDYEEFTVTAKSLGDALISFSKDGVELNEDSRVVVYTGEAQTIGVTVKDGETTLKEGTDYTLSWKKDGVEVESVEFKDLGTYEVTVTGTGNYTGTTTKEFTISYGDDSDKFDISPDKTLTKDIYPGYINFMAKDGYRISDNLTDWAISLSRANSASEGLDIYVKNENSGEISKAHIDAFTVSNTKPEITKCEVSDADAWAQSKTITVTASGADYGVYYGTKQIMAESPITNADALDGLESVTVKDENDGNYQFTVNAEDTYYVYAVNQNGNYVKQDVKVDKIDNTTPIVTITAEGHQDADGTFWKNSNNLPLKIKVEDNESGFNDNSQMIKLTWPNNQTYSQGLGTGTSTEIEFTAKTASTYAIEVTDAAGNKTTTSFTVKQDIDTPSVTIDKENATAEDSKKLFHNSYDERDIYWTNGTSITVPLTISENAQDTTTEQSGYTLQVSKNSDMADAEEVTVDKDTATATYSCAVTEQETQASENGYITYYFQVTDYAGNESDIQSINVACDQTAPTITSVTFPQDSNKDGWLNAAELKTEDNSNGYVGLDVDVSDGDKSVGLGFNAVQYSIDGGQTWKNVGGSDKDPNSDVYSIATLETADGSTYNWKVKVTDDLGNEAELAPTTQAQVDATAPESTAYVQFTTDTAGENDQTIGTSGSDSWTSKIWNLATKEWNKIWGKQKVSFDLYLQDKTSGMKDVTLTYTGDSKYVTLSTTGNTLTRVEGLKAFTEGDAGATDASSQDPSQGYTVYTGEITVAAGATLEVSDFQITGMTDVAGNEQTKAIVKGGQKFIYLDAVNPKLTEVSVDGESVTEKETYFYSEEKQIKLSIEERFFEEGNKPTVTLWKKSSTDKEFATSEAQYLADQTWTKEGTGDTYTTYVNLPAETEQEIEYQITLVYSDPSANALVGDTGISGVNNGVYSSKVFVIDTKAPQLLKYTVNDPTSYDFDGMYVYENDADEDDLQVSFTLDENASYIDDTRAKLFVEVYEKGEDGDTLVASTDASADADVETLSVNREAESDGADNRSFTYSFGFDGTDTSENAYYVTFGYQDAAGNLLESEYFTIKNGTYTSASYIIDHVAPKMEVSFNEAYQVTDSKSQTVEGKKPLDGAEYTSYYGEAEGEITLTVTLDEKYLKLYEDGTVADFDLAINGKETPITFEKTGDTIYTGTYSIEEEGAYWIELAYEDTAGNAVTAGDKVEGGTVEDGFYISSDLVLDTTAPELIATYAAEAVNQCDARKYYKADTNLNIQVIDENIRYKELKESLETMKAVDIQGKAVESTAAKAAIDAIEEYGTAFGSWEVDLPLSTEANYTFPISYTDLAGNSTTIATEEVTVDKTSPELEFSYSIKDPINYLPFGWFFSKEKMTITASAKDAMSGVQYIIFTVTDENGKVTTKTREMKPAADGSYAVTIPLETADFKGTVKAEVLDWSVNSIDQTRNHVVEESGRHAGSGSATVTTITKPSRTVKGVDYYNTDVAFRLTLADSYSGLRNWKYTAGSKLSAAKDYAAEAGTDLGTAPTKNVTYKYEEEMTLTGKDNDQNDVQVLAGYTDNTGRTGQVEQKYNIDITKPTIQVEYDLNGPANGKYYNQTRTATVTITERNFDPADVDFKITNTDGKMPSISSWSTSGSGNDTKHVCKVVFGDDGDYTFTLSFQDLAGNKADYTRVDEFTIDKTIPTVTVTWDNNSYLNGYYYSQGRTATIDVLEHNFDAALMNVIVTAAGDATGKPAVSGWTRNGDHNIAHVSFLSDGDYTFDIEGRDMADNLLADYEMERFIVDQTAPDLEIFDIENMSANNGIVQPGVRYSDTNNDVDGTVIVMKGFKNGVVDMNGTRTQTANGMELKLNDFAHTQDMDDMYTMEASVYDLAGNSSEASVTFSVNRFGSVYTFDEATDELVGENGKYYTNEPQKLVVTETNVDTLEFREITNNLNGQLQTMEEGKDYKVSESGSEVSWKQYTYTIDKENFEEEGTYLLTIYSEDRATNTSDNNTKGKKIEFVMDKTSPSILISGVENNGQYRESSRDVTLDIQDNVRLAEVKVVLDGQETTYTAADVEKADGKLTIKAGSANHWQEMEVTAYDAAGNEKTADSIRFLITSNILVQFFMNKPLFYGVCIAILALGGGWWFLVAAKRKKKEEEQEQG